MWIKYPWNTSNFPYIELARTLFPVESTNDIKIEITQHRVVGDECIWEGISLMNTSWVSVLSTFKMQSVLVCKRKCLMEK